MAKGKSKKKPRATLTPSSPPSSSSPPPPTTPPRPPPPGLFLSYPSANSTSSTPLPPPSMPRKPFLRRIVPIILVGSGERKSLLGQRRFNLSGGTVRWGRGVSLPRGLFATC